MIYREYLILGGVGGVDITGSGYFFGVCVKFSGPTFHQCSRHQATHEVYEIGVLIMKRQQEGERTVADHLFTPGIVV